jgi:hypothetical protein
MLFIEAGFVQMIIFSVGSKILGKVGMQNFMNLASRSQISKHPSRVGICSVHGCQEMAVTSPILHGVEGMEKIRINFEMFSSGFLSFLRYISVQFTSSVTEYRAGQVVDPSNPLRYRCSVT